MAQNIIDLGSGRLRLLSREGDGGGFKDIEFLEQLCFYLGNFRATRFYLNLVVSAFPKL